MYFAPPTPQYMVPSEAMHLPPSFQVPAPVPQQRYFMQAPQQYPQQYPQHQPMPAPPFMYGPASPPPTTGQAEAKAQEGHGHEGHGVRDAVKSFFGAQTVHTFTPQPPPHMAYYGPPQ